MKRFAIGLVAAILTAGSLAPSAEAWHRYEPYRHSYDEYAYDRVYQALTRCDRVLLNNFYDGYRYRSAGAWLSPHEVRYAGRTWGGGYRVWFRGDLYRARVADYRGRLCLYLGSAPTPQGYRFELVLD
jgi:hypothetical protein